MKLGNDLPARAKSEDEAQSVPKRRLISTLLVPAKIFEDSTADPAKKGGL